MSLGYGLYGITSYLSSVLKYVSPIRKLNTNTQTAEGIFLLRGWHSLVILTTKITFGVGQKPYTLSVVSLVEIHKAADFVFSFNKTKSH